MIDLFDNLLRQFLIEQIGELTDESQVRFQPPNNDWRTYISTLVIGANPVNALNVYLTEVRENRKLRSNEKVRSVENGMVSEEPAPARLDCHYLISAWSPATVSPAVEPTLDEHALLYQVAAVLMQQGAFNPSRIYPAGSAALNAWPAPFRNVELPFAIAPVEGFIKLAEFWSGMGSGALWKPVLYLTVTLPVALFREIAGPMVTTRITEYRFANRPDTAEVFIEIGGHVLTPLPPLPLAVGNSQVTGAAGLSVTVASAAPFRAGDVVTVNNVARATVSQIAGTTLTLNAALAGLAIGDTLRIANIPPLVAGNSLVTAVADLSVTVASAAAFRAGDVVTVNNGARVVVSQILGNTLTLNVALDGLAIGDTLRIANVPPPQTTFRLTGVTGLRNGGMALLFGDDAANPGNTVTDRVVVQSFAANGSVTLSDALARANTFNLDVAPANAPALTPLEGMEGAWVRLEDIGGTPLQEATTNAEGRFKFAGLREGNYILRVRVQGFAEVISNIVVPSTTGNYDVQL